MKNRNIGNILGIIGILVTIYLGVYYVPEWVKGIQHDNKKTSLFKGNVGNLAATFNLRIDYSEQTVNGNYFYPSLPNIIYRISGSIPTKTQMYLTEFTQGTQTASCTLLTSDDVCWAGRMENTDGKVFNMSFCKVSE